MFEAFQVVGICAHGRQGWLGVAAAADSIYYQLPCSRLPLTARKRLRVDRVPESGDAVMCEHFAECPSIFEMTQAQGFQARRLSGSSFMHSLRKLIYLFLLIFVPLIVTNGTSHSPTALNGAPSPPNGFSNGPSSSSSSSLANQQLPPACGARQLSKLKRFLTTLQQFGNDISPEIGERVRTLVLGLVVSNQKSVFWDQRQHRGGGGVGRAQKEDGPTPQPFLYLLLLCKSV